MRKKRRRVVPGIANAVDVECVERTECRRHRVSRCQVLMTRRKVCFPIVSVLGGYPAGYDNSNFVFIIPYESDRKKWKSLTGVNLADGQKFQIAMRPTANQEKVIPDSFRIVLHNYLGKPEVKSLAPDGTPCTGATQGLLLRAKIIAGKLVPVGKETDRRWEQGEDPSMLDSQVYVYEKQRKMVVADASERKSWSAIGVRRLTLSIIREAAAKIQRE